MVERYDCRYSYVLLESDQSTDTADEEDKPFDEKKETDFDFIDDFRDIKYNYIWLGDNEVLPESRDCSEKIMGRGNEPKATGKENDLPETFCKEIDYLKSTGDGLSELKEKKNEESKEKNLGNDKSGSVIDGHTLSSALVGCRSEIICRNLIESDHPSTCEGLNKCERKQDMREGNTNVKGDPCSKIEIENTYKTNTCDSHEKTVEDTFKENRENRNGSKHYSDKGKNENETQLKAKEVELIDDEDDKMKSLAVSAEADDRKNRKRSTESKGRLSIDTKKRTKRKIEKHVRGQKNKWNDGKLNNVQYSKFKGKGKYKTSEDKLGENKNSDIKCDVPVTDARSGDNLNEVRSSKTDECDVISELCPVFNRCALGTRNKTKSILKMALNKQKDTSRKLCEPVKGSYKIPVHMRSKSLPPPIKIDRQNEGFWIRKDKTIFGGLKQAHGESSEFKSSVIENDLREHDNEKDRSDQSVPEHSKTKFKGSDVVKAKLTPKLFGRLGKGEMSKNVNLTKLTKVRKNVKIRDSSLKNVCATAIPKCKNWLRCMPTPTTGKLLKGSINDGSQLKSETKNNEQSHTSSNCVNDQMNGAEPTFIEINKSDILMKESIKEIDVLAKEQIKEPNQMQPFTNKPVEVLKGVIHENQEIMCSPIEMNRQNLKQLEGKTCLKDQDSYELPEIGKKYTSVQNSCGKSDLGERKTCIVDQNRCDHSDLRECETCISDQNSCKHSGSRERKSCNMDKSRCDFSDLRESKTCISDQNSYDQSDLKESKSISDKNRCDKTDVRESITCTYTSDQNSAERSNAGEMNYKVEDRVDTMDSKHLPGKNRPDVKKDAVKRIRNKRKGKEVKVFKTVKGIGKIEFRYPCKFCGELFSKGYVLRHERSHLTEGYRNLYQGYYQRVGTTDKAVVTDPGEKVSNRSSLSKTKGSTNSTEHACTTESSQISPVSNLLTTSNIANATTMPSSTVYGAGTNTDDADRKGGTKVGKSFSEIGEVCARKEGQAKILLDKEAEIGSLLENKVVTEKPVNTKSSGSASPQCSSDDFCLARNKRMSSQAETTSNQKKGRLNAVDNEEHPGEIKCENKSELYGGKFSCTMCTYSSSYNRYLKRHLTVHRSCASTVTCECGITFRNRLTMSQWHKRNNISCGMEHMKRITNLKSKTYSRKNQRLDRERQKKERKGKSKVLKTVKVVAKKRANRRLKCEKCNYRFSNFANWIKHEQLHKNNEGFTCLECCITMKTRCSLRFWHHRHGIHHPRKKRERCRRIKKKREQSNHRTCEFNPDHVDTQEPRTKTSEIVRSQSCSDCNAHIVVDDIEYIRLNEKLDGTTCDKCSLKLGNVEIPKPEKLDRLLERDHCVDAGGMVYKIDTDNKFSDKDQSNTVRESINNSLKELTLKIEAQGKDRPSSKSINKFKENMTVSDISSVESTEHMEGASDFLNGMVHSKKTVIYQEDDNLRESQNSARLHGNQEEIMKRESLVQVSKGDFIEKTSTSKEVPVYPLLRRLSLKDGEQVYSPVDDEIEVFEKECDINKNYRKVRVLNIDTNGCQEKTDVSKSSIPFSEIEQEKDISEREGGDENKRILSLRENSEVNFIEPLDLSVKKYKQKNLPVKGNSKVSISFQIEIDFDQNDVANCRMSNMQTFVCHVDTQGENSSEVRHPNKAINCSLTDPVGTKIMLKNIHAVPHNDKHLTIIDKRNIPHVTVENTSNIHGVPLEDTTICQRNSIAESDKYSFVESDVHNQIKHYDEMNKEGQKDDVYTFTGDESDDVFYYASKLQERSGSDRYTINFDNERYGQLATMGVNTVQDTLEESVCDTGGTDENNNREKEGVNSFTENRATRVEGNDNSNSSNAEDKMNSGDDNGDDDKENNDRNNDAGNNPDKFQNVELLPCLVCQAVFNSKTELLRHLTKIHRLTNLCQICYFDEGQIRRFANPVSLRNHKVRDHPEDMVKCVCGAMLIDNKMLSSHLKKFKCNIYESGGESNEMAKCICGKRFSSQELLLKHRSKCRKRHCLDETFLEFINLPSTRKKRCQETKTKENTVATETTGMTLRAKPKDINNNISLSEDSDTSHGRICKVRKCKGNVVSYNEKAYDKYFKTAYSKRQLYGGPEHTRRYERLPCTQRLSESSLTSNDEVLDLRTKSARDRNSISQTESVTDDTAQLDTNNNYAVQGTSTSYNEVRKDISSDKLPFRGSLRYFEEEKIDNGTKLNKIVKQDKADNNNKLVSRSLKKETQSDTGSIRKLMKSDADRPSKKTSGGKRKKKVQPDAEGKYPCKVCRRRFKKPYLYTHQKVVHAPKQWILVPTTSGKKYSDGEVKYRCNWCRFVSLHWGTAVRHHYMEHQKKELDLITLTSVPKVLPDFFTSVPKVLPSQLEDSSVHHLLKDYV